MNKNKFPNLLIVGAAKSGTTSLHKYLEEHNEIHMSTPKEPKYLSNVLNEIQYSGKGDDEVKSNIISDEEEYFELFDPNFKINGESSADYLYYYDKTIPIIKSKLNNPAIVIILRNPIERAYSAYNHLVRDGREQYDFERGMALEDLRIDKGYEFIWHYKKCGLYFNQVKSYLDNFERCKVVLFDDLKADSQRVVDDICDMIKVTSIKINSNKVFNPSGIPKRNLKTFILRIFEKSKIIKKIGGVFIPIKLKKQINTRLRNVLLFNNLNKPIMDDKIRTSLVEYFEEDVKKLGNLIERDLSHWLK